MPLKDQFITVRCFGLGDERLLQTSKEEALQFLEFESNVLVAITFQHGDQRAAELSQMISRFHVLPPPFECQASLQLSAEDSRVVEYAGGQCMEGAMGINEKTAQLSSALRKWGCSRIMHGHGHWENCVLFCAAGFRRRSQEGPADSEAGQPQDPRPNASQQAPEHSSSSSQRRTTLVHAFLFQVLVPAARCMHGDHL